MIARSVSEYVMFGTTLRYLQDAQPGSLIHNEAGLLDNLARFLQILAPSGYWVTVNASGRLQSIHERLKATENDHVLSLSEARELAEAATSIRDTLMAELQGHIAFVVTDKRIEVRKLLWTVETLLSPGRFAILSDIAQFDLREAGICLAFDRPTAAAFHILRATEDTLRRVYSAYVPPMQQDTLMLWGPMVEQLVGLPTAPGQALLDHLKNIKNNFRNPTQHPEKAYDIEEAQDLFNLCVDVLNRMALCLAQQSAAALPVPAATGPVE
jgi:hypothetical protein